MKIFVVAMYDCIEGEMNLEKIAAETDVNALCKMLELDPEALPEGVTADVDDIIQYSFDGDCPVAIIEI